MTDAVVILVIVVFLIFALKGSVKHFKGEGACCGGGSGTVKSRKPRKKKLDGPVIGHYTVRISGMHCQNCVNSVTNAINSVAGASAKISLHSKSADVSFDRDVDKEELKRAVEKAGFEVVSIS